MAALTAAMNAFLSNEPACWASIEATFASLACPAMSSDGASAASWASFALDAAGGCARLSLANAFTLPVTCLNAGSCSGATDFGATGGCNSWSADSGAAGIAVAPPPEGAAGGAAPRGPPPPTWRASPRPCRADLPWAPA